MSLTSPSNRMTHYKTRDAAAQVAGAAHALVRLASAAAAARTSGARTERQQWARREVVESGDLATKTRTDSRDQQGNEHAGFLLESANFNIPTKVGRPRRADVTTLRGRWHLPLESAPPAQVLVTGLSFPLESARSARVRLVSVARPVASSEAVRPPPPSSGDTLRGPLAQRGGGVWGSASVHPCA